MIPSQRATVAACQEAPPPKGPSEPLLTSTAPGSAHPAERRKAGPPPQTVRDRVEPAVLGAGDPQPEQANALGPLPDVQDEDLMGVDRNFSRTMNVAAAMPAANRRRRTAATDRARRGPVEPPPGDIGGREQEQRENEPERARIEFFQLLPKERAEGFPPPFPAHLTMGKTTSRKARKGGPSRDRRSFRKPAGPLRTRARGVNRPAMRKNSPIAKSEPSTMNRSAGMRKALLLEGSR